MRRDEVLREAERLINADRRDTYGEVRENFETIAGLWSVWLGVKVGAVDVAAMMIMVKAARLKVSPEHVDSWVDIAGYAALGAEVADDSMGA